MRAFLQGAYDSATGAMRTALRSASRLPVAQPYNAAPWNYSGNESVSTTMPDSLVDWVLVEVRPSPSASAVARRAAILLKNGSVVDLDGVSPIGMTSPSGLYYLVLRHRNHLAVMTVSSQQVSFSSATYDFTVAMNSAYGTEPMTGLFGGGAPYGLWAGDVTANGQLAYTGTGNDPAAILTILGGTDMTASVNGYYLADTNLDSVVSYSGVGNDRAIILLNIGGYDPALTRSSQVP
jgi:hypothetical protein